MRGDTSQREIDEFIWRAIIFVIIIGMTVGITKACSLERRCVCEEVRK